MKSKSLGEKLLSLPIKNCDEECSKFWNKFGARFLQAFEASNYSLTSHAMRNWMKNETIPDNALTNDMYPPANASKDTLGITNVFAACIPGPENYAGLTTLNFEKQFHDPHFHYGCNDEEVLIRVRIIITPLMNIDSNGLPRKNNVSILLFHKLLLDRDTWMGTPSLCRHTRPSYRWMLSKVCCRSWSHRNTLQYS